MLTVRQDSEIYRERGGWFDARWHFSFDRYRDPQQMGVGALRVFNDDRIVAGAEWPMHPHRDIESLTYVVEGHFEHADSLGNDGQLEPGAAQVMSFSHAATCTRTQRLRTEPCTSSSSGSCRADQSDSSSSTSTESDRTNRWLQIMSAVSPAWTLVRTRVVSRPVR